MAETVELQIKITNSTKVMKAMAMLIDSETYRGILRDTIRETLRYGTVYAGEITHRRTGYLAESHAWEYNTHTMRGRIYINPRVVYLSSPRSSTLRWPATYGTYEEQRGGTHAFYGRTIKEAMPYTAMQGLNIAVRRLAWP